MIDNDNDKDKQHQDVGVANPLNPSQCQYYPCHIMPDGSEFRCNPQLCACPLYPCGDMTRGYWLDNGWWDCTTCVLNHTKEFEARYKLLLKHLN